MAGDCCGANCATGDGISPRYRKALWAVLWINAATFAVEIAGAQRSARYRGWPTRRIFRAIPRKAVSGRRSSIPGFQSHWVFALRGCATPPAGCRVRIEKE